MTTRYGLIGAGMMGQEHIRNLALLEGTELAAVADPNSTMREQSRQLAGPACVGYEHHQQMLAAEKLDALVVASPNHTHHPVLSDVLDAGLPILCEKPLGISQSECADLEKKVADAGVPLWVAMEYRYMPPVQRLLDELHAGSVGHIHMLSIREHRYPFLEKVGNWNRYEETSGGTMVEKCCHFFDLMRLILQSEPTRVYASGALNVNHQDETHLDQPADVIDNAYVIVDFASGARAMLDICMFAEGSQWQETISVTGNKARADAYIPGPLRFAPDGQEVHAEVALSPRADKKERRWPIPVDDAILRAGDHHGSTFYQHQKFLNLVRNGGTPEVSVKDGAIAVAVGAAAEKSIKTGQPVDL